MEERKKLGLLHDMHPEHSSSAQIVSETDEGWCSAEFSSGCILEDE